VPRIFGLPRRASIAAGICLIVVLAAFIGLGSRWIVTVSQSPSPATAANISGSVRYQFVSEHVGWISVLDSSGNDTVQKTSDGGQSWHRQLVLTGMSPTPSIQFFGVNDGVVVGQRGNYPAAWRTTDGGNHWLVSRDSTGGIKLTVISADFVDSSQGWMLTTVIDTGPASIRTYFVYQTTDGGDTWTRVGGVDLGAGTFAVQIHFSTANVGFVTSFTTVGNVPLFTSRDSGRTWDRFNLAILPIGAAGFVTFMQELSSFANGVSLLPVTLAREVAMPCPLRTPSGLASPGIRCQTYRVIARYVYSTSVGGQWSGPQTVAQSGALYFIDPMHWLALNSRDFALTVDGGQNWSLHHAIPVSPGWYATQVQFLDADRGWVALSDHNADDILTEVGSAPASTSNRFMLLRTSDGGVSWREVELPR
jgi:hypothetical protein